MSPTWFRRLEKWKVERRNYYGRSEKLVEERTERIIRCATLAPSGHNTQPWRFATDRNQNVIRIFPDLTRRLAVVDNDDHELFISLGCALENLTIAAKHEGYDSRVAYFPADEANECIRVTLIPEARSNDRRNSALLKAIEQRHTNRSPYNQRGIPPDQLKHLQDAARREDVTIKLLTDRPHIEAMVPFVRDGNMAEFGNRAFTDELISWFRFNKTEAQTARDGLYAPAMGMPPMPHGLGKLLLKLFATPKSQAGKMSNQIRSSSALAIFVAKNNDKSTWVKTGQSFERFWLTATLMKISVGPANMPCEVPTIREQLAARLKLRSAQPLLLIRLGYGKPMPESLRRPVEQVTEAA